MVLQKIEIDVDRIKDEIGHMAASEIDQLPFGAIQLDETGKVLTYNRYEANFARRNTDEVIGRNFFTEIAPCTSVKAFKGAFEDGVRRRKLDEVFDFVFKFSHGPKQVRIRMIYASIGKPSIWIFVTPIE